MIASFWRKCLKAFGQALKNNLGLKIAAVIFAVILWSYVMAETNPPRPKSLENIPVTIQNIESLKARGLTISEDLSKVLKKGVRVNLEVRQKELKLVNEDNVSASIDFATTNGKGEMTFKINGATKYGTVTSVEPKNIQLTVDEYIKKQIPVKCTVKGAGQTGYFVGVPTISPNVIEIIGARKDVEKAASAVCEVDITNKTTSINQSVDVKILDSNGNALDNSVYFENLPSVIVQIDILPIKKVPVNAEGSILNASKVKAGYEIGEIKVEPAEVEIAAEQSVLNGISEVVLSDMDVSGAYENTIFTVKPKALEGVRFLSSDPIQVTVNISQIQSKKSFSDVTVALLNRPPGSKVYLDPETVDVTVSGGIKDIEFIRRNYIKLFVDLSGLSKGTYTLPVHAQNVDTLKTSKLSFSMSEIKVIIK